MIKNLALIFILALTSAQAVSQTTLQADSATLELFEVVISADYLADKHTPVTYQNIGTAYLEHKNTGQEPSFLLSETPSMTVYSDAGSYQGYSYFRMRGIDQTRLNMTLDGVPLNEPEDQGVYFSNYPDFFNSISKVQIQRGIGTSKNGTSSYAGSLQFTSPSLLDSTRTAIGFGYGSFGTYRAFGEFNSGLKENKALYIRASRLHSEGYKERSANTSGSAFYSAGLFMDNSSLKLTGFWGNQKNQMAWLGVSQEEIDANPTANANSKEDDSFTQSLTQLQYIWYLTEKSTLRSSVFYNYLNGNYDFDLNNFLGLPPTDELYNYAFESHFGGIFTNYTYETSKLRWTTGIQANKYRRDHYGTERTLGKLYKNTGFKNEMSAFSKALREVGKAVLFTDLQVRHTNFDYTGTAPFPKTSWTFFNPKAGITYNVNAHQALYYSIGRAGREPTRNDMFGGMDDLPVDSLGIPVLSITEPEFVVNHELGFRFNKEKLYANMNLYYMDFDNEIVLNGQFGPNGLALNSNVEQSIRTGVEFSLSYSPSPQVKLVNNSSYNYSKIGTAEKLE